MARSRDMNAFNPYDDLVEHLYGKEIIYLSTADDIPNEIKVRDIFKLADGSDNAVMYILNANAEKGFIELAFDATADASFTKKETQTEAKAYLTSLL